MTSYSIVFDDSSIDPSLSEEFNPRKHIYNEIKANINSYFESKDQKERRKIITKINKLAKRYLYKNYSKAIVGRAKRFFVAAKINIYSDFYRYPNVIALILSIIDNDLLKKIMENPIVGENVHRTTNTTKKNMSYKNFDEFFEYLKEKCAAYQAEAGVINEFIMPEPAYFSPSIDYTYDNFSYYESSDFLFKPG